MAFDAFIKIDGIPGECTDDKHKDWIEVLSYGFGVHQAAGASSTGGGRASARADFGDFTVTKVLDKASPKLFLFCANGTHIKEVKLELCRAAGDKQKYQEFKLTDVIVSGYNPNGAAQGAESLPLEQVSFNYGKIEHVYTETDHKTGKPKGDVKAHWSLVENKGG